MPEWRESVVEFVRANALPVDKFGHQPRLYALACKIGHALAFDDDILFAAAWMHDLGSSLATARGSSATCPLGSCPVHHCSQPRTARRLRISAPKAGCRRRSHPHPSAPGHAQSNRGHPPADADILEQLGAVGALRAIAKVDATIGSRPFLR